MKIKSGVWYWLAMACFVVGLIYALGIEGGAQVGQPVTDSEFITAMALILASIALMRLAFVAKARETRRQSRYGKINRTHARNAEYPALPEHSSRRGA